MANDLGPLTFQPEDFDTVVPFEIMVCDLTKIIKEIRKENPDKKLKKEIDEIRKEVKNIEKNTWWNDNYKKSDKIKNVLKVYKQIQYISLKLRKILKKSIKGIELYDNIGYAFYYKGKRYTTETIKEEWLDLAEWRDEQGRIHGELLIDVGKAVKDIEKSIITENQKKIMDMIAAHLGVYTEAITKMYKGPKNSSKINKGRISEAFESHLALHHSISYKSLNNLTTKSYSIADKLLFVNDIFNFEVDYWKDHETENEAWAHLRAAQGTQRGTVAGDIRDRQVKEVEKSRKRSLSSLKNLQMGLEIYINLFNNQKDPEKLAKEIATYLTEPVKIDSQKLLAKIANTEMRKIFENYFNRMKEIKLINI